MSKKSLKAYPALDAFGGGHDLVEHLQHEVADEVLLGIAREEGVDALDCARPVLLRVVDQVRHVQQVPAPMLHPEKHCQSFMTCQKKTMKIWDAT